jgi:hypothetical protein
MVCSVRRPSSSSSLTSHNCPLTFPYTDVRLTNQDVLSNKTWKYFKETMSRNRRPNTQSFGQGQTITKAKWTDTTEEHVVGCVSFFLSSHTLFLVFFPSVFCFPQR